MSIHVFGIRHHGPGCARSLRAALETLEPDILLVEGPPDAQAVLPLLTHQEMHPPVALLIYAPDQPRNAVYYPFNTFSPEWQALTYALTKGVPARFMDLPQAIQFARRPAEPAEEAQPETPVQDDPQRATATSSAVPAAAEPAPNLQDDPLALLAQAAGYSDHELWWEQQIEQRQDMNDLFAGILEAMSALRSDPTPKNEEVAQREAHMRQTIRAAQKEGFQRIAVVCGAWHAPVLVEPGPAKADSALLKGLKQVKVEATWIPWTNSRLSYRSGYGAGVNSPGWYEHLWTHPTGIATRWIANAAQLLRKEGLDASSASVIEAVRLGDALSAMRDLPMPGMAELHEAILTVLCHGNETPMQLIRDKLEIGDRLGQVPPETPAVPLQRDLEAQQRHLRLKPSTEIVTLELDVRKDGDRERSFLLHRLRLLGIAWGEMRRVAGNKAGSFHEHWRVQWQVEFAVALIEANIWGNTVESAATQFIRHSADTIDDLPKLTALLDDTILAELPEAIDHLLTAIQQRAAVSSDIQHMMDALPALAQVARYGNVRKAKVEHILPIIDGLFERIIIGLPGACAALDDDAAQAMVESMNRVHESVLLLNREGQKAEWLKTLRGLVDRDGVHGFVRGRCCRILLEQHSIDEAELQRLTKLTLSPATEPAQAASWIEGVLQGSGLLMLNQDALWRALDGWMSNLAPDLFVALLPILRRAFSNFQGPERRKMGEKVKHIHASSETTHTTADGDQSGINQEHARRVLPLLAQLMGVTYHAN